MFGNFNSPQKRPASTTNDGLIVKRSKLSEENDQNKENLPLPSTIVENVELRKNDKISLVSLIQKDQTKNVLIYPGQIVWCRLEKSPFWPSMVWTTKLGKIRDENHRILVRFFSKSDSSIWMKLDNVFPFDGLDSFEKMKNSVDMSQFTPSVKNDFNFAFNITNKSWSRAVAEATYCLEKDQGERQATFLAFLSSLTHQDSVQNEDTTKRTPFRRLDSTRNGIVDQFTIHEELNRIKSFVQKISFPVEEPSRQVALIAKNDDKKENTHDDKKDDQKNDKKDHMQTLLTYVIESLNTEQFDGEIKICNICSCNKSSDKLIKCAGTCGGYLHEKCYQDRVAQSLDERDNEEQLTRLYCEDCVNQSKSLCFICKSEASSESKIVTCSVQNCWRSYHMNCLKFWPQVKFIYDDQVVICPSHECHNCTSNTMENGNAIIGEISTCIKCPTAFHNHSSCIHAGSIILSKSHHICIKHRKLRKHIWNLDYCHVCKSGCELSHCETCPNSFHQSCLQQSPTSPQTICAECFNGQHPVYADIVWTKVYTYPWWPAIVVPPQCIPANIANINHSPHAICVCFFGDHSYSWVERESMHRFDEDNLDLYGQSSKKLTNAILSARQWLQQVKLKKETRPVLYKKILKSTPIPPATFCYDNDNEASVCECKGTDFDPCGPRSVCINRWCYTECNDSCPCGDKCRNKRLQQKEHAKVYSKYLGNKGFGLIAAEEIPKRSIVIEYVGEIITLSEFQRRGEDPMRSNCYVMKYMKGQFIDGETKGNLSRFINHSCNPNCSFEKWNVNGVCVVAVVALKPIPKNTEITCRYDWSRNIPCLCNEENCSGFC